LDSVDDDTGFVVGRSTKPTAAIVGTVVALMSNEAREQSCVCC
jgi:hypothetical protein